MNSKSFEIIEFRKEIKIAVREVADGELVSGCEYRKRKTSSQIEFERAKWIGKGYREV